VKPTAGPATTKTTAENRSKDELDVFPINMIGAKISKDRIIMIYPGRRIAQKSTRLRKDGISVILFHHINNLHDLSLPFAHVILISNLSIGDSKEILDWSCRRGGITLK
jgi:hypothetical protein